MLCQLIYKELDLISTYLPLARWQVSDGRHVKGIEKYMLLSIAEIVTRADRHCSVEIIRHDFYCLR